MMVIADVAIGAFWLMMAVLCICVSLVCLIAFSEAIVDHVRAKYFR